jgi:hypothetical protein
MINDTELMCVVNGIKDSSVYKYLMAISDHDITEIKYKYGISYLYDYEQEPHYLDRDVYISYKLLSIFYIHRLLMLLRSRVPLFAIIHAFRKMQLVNARITYEDITHLRLTYNQDHRPISTIIFDSIPIKDMERRGKHADIKI